MASARHHNNLGVALMDHGKQAEAIAEFRSALAEWGGHVTARVNLGAALYYDNDDLGALEALEVAVREAPADPRAHYLLGLVHYYHTARYDEAAKRFGEVARLDPSDSWTRFYLGLSLSRSGQVASAAEELRRAVDLNPGHQAAIYQLSLALRSLGRLEEATESLERFKRLRAGFPASAAPGVGYMEQGRHAETVADSGAGGNPLRFGPAGPGRPAALAGTSIGMATRLDGDIDNDGIEESLLLEEGRINLRHGGAGGLEQPPGSRAVAAALADLDHDGDLDLHVVRDRQSDLLFRNDGTGRFTEIARRAGVDGGVGAKSGLVFGDFDNDRAIDLCVSRTDGPPALYFNNRDGTFAERGTEAGLSRVTTSTGVAAGDVDNDGYLDLLFSRTTGRPVLLLGRRGRFFEPTDDAVAPGPVPGSDPRCAFWDADRDGDLDVVCADAGAVDAGASASLFLNDSIRSDGDNSVTVRVQGLIKPQVLSNYSGIGARVEIRAPGSWLLREVQAGTGLRVGSGSALTFGLGNTARLDYVRVSFPSGVRLTRREVAAGETLTLEEPAGKFTSCPMIYAWDGERFRFVNDTLGFAVLGEWEPPGRWFHPDPDEWLRIDGGKLRPEAGRALVRFVNQLEEVSFSDTIRLVAVDHPAAVGVYPDEPNRAPAQDLAPPPVRAVRGIRPLVAATDERGNSVLERLSAIDGSHHDGFVLLAYRGLARPHALVLDAGPMTEPQPVLLLHGWTDWGSSSSMRAASQAGLSPEPISLEVIGQDGEWRVAIEDIGLPAGLPRTLVVPLSGLFHGNDHRIRIRTNLVVYWDAIQVGNEESGNGLSFRELPLLEARLRWIGYPRPVRHGSAGARSTPVSYDYDERDREAEWGRFRGGFTRYGEVTELLARRDDQFVVMNHGEEIALAFDTGLLPALPPGARRDYLLFVDGYGKDMDVNSAHPSSVAPWPFHAMPAYPYPAESGLEPAAMEYLLKWNTRSR